MFQSRTIHGHIPSVDRTKAFKKWFLRQTKPFGNRQFGKIGFWVNHSKIEK